MTYPGDGGAGRREVEWPTMTAAAAVHGGWLALTWWHALRRDGNRRWELTANHWDLPIHAVDPHASPE